ncbi:hypothetical protein JTE90_027673 [Oedothorax gibbosus]|uniref:Uncharacterized protein n=1 Tax=Oedothorax gibbosus TaxID=931172 RepID=A0AAV6UQE6_9ARAC|nr:hypothetical protein JTE90_027673 [Oedothorax gibbosus]
MTHFNPELKQGHEIFTLSQFHPHLKRPTSTGFPLQRLNKPKVWTTPRGALERCPLRHLGKPFMDLPYLF